MRNSKIVLSIINASDKIFPAISGDQQQRITNIVSIVGGGGFGRVSFWSIGFLFMIIMIEF